MSSNNKLLVPMYMEALLLRDDKQDCLDISPRFDQYDQSVLGERLQPDSTNNITLEKGIHLHWTLPKALKHSFLDKGDEAKFPFAPNRWMVIRIQTDTDKGIKNMPSRMWVIESDYTNDNPDRRNLVLMKKQRLDFSGVGKCFDYPYTSTNNKSEPVLRAVGAANPFFASFYPECQNVFGFHDDLKDIGDCTLTYIVTGWYSDPAADPLAALDFDGDIPDEQLTDQQRKRKRERNWFTQQWKCNTKDYPTASLFHSAIHSVQWNNSVTGDGVPAGPIEVIAGNTSVEAMSVKIRDSSGDSSPVMEDLLNALQYQLLDDDGHPPGLTAIKEETHKRGFNSKNGGLMWEVKRLEANDKELEGTKDKRVHFPKDPNIIKDLNQLNQLQAEFNSVSRETQSWQQEYYLLWYKKAKKNIDKLNVDKASSGFVFDKAYDQGRRDAMDRIQKNTGQIATLTQQIKDLKDKLAGYEELTGPKRLFEVNEKESERFWEANEPVLLLCGAGVGNVDKPNFKTEEKEIPCRIIDQLLKGLDLMVPNIPANIPVKVPVTDFVVQNLNGLNATDIPAEEIKALVHESLLFANGLSADIALLAYNYASLGRDKDKGSDVIITFAREVTRVQQGVLDKDIPADKGNAGIQSPAKFSVNKWLQAWSPLFMMWEVNFHPSYKDLKGLDLANNTHWELEDSLFYKDLSAKVDTREQITSLFNITPFSTAVFSNLKRTLPNDVVNRYGTLNLIAQSLSGLHKELLTQKPVIQLPPLEYTIIESGPNRGFNTDHITDQAELGAIGADGYRLGANPGSVGGTDQNIFHPLRSGFLQLLNLSIVDVFGQVKQVIVDQGNNNPVVKYPHNLKGSGKIPPNCIPLAPRLVQPSRLQFNWLKAKDSLHTSDEILFQDFGDKGNPVFGWVVPNFLDNSLMIYDGAGKEIMILQITNDISKRGGINLRGMPFPGSVVIPDLTTNPHLAKFINTIGEGPVVEGLIDLALKVNLNITGTNALHSNTSAALCGQPVALVRCSVQLETFGLPVFNQKWDQTGIKNTGDIESVQIPLYLGNYQKEKDGLIGYFLEDDTKSAIHTALHTTMNAPEFKNSKSVSFFKANTPAKLSVNQDALNMTLLIDPSAGMHISSGILPTKYVELFPFNSQDLLSSLNISFMMAPFIAEKVDPGVPVPTSINAGWKWTHKTDVTTWEKDADIAAGKNKQRSVFKKYKVYEGWLRLSNLKTNN